MYSTYLGEKYVFQDSDKVNFISGNVNQPINGFAVYSIKNMEFDLSVKQEYCLSKIEAIVINDKYSFELALILKKKEFQREILTKNILNRINEKRGILEEIAATPSICMIGHSQLDNWEIGQLGKYKIRNCGIRGISSFEYKEYILDKEMLNCKSDVFLVMHGTNDIIGDYSMEEIGKSIEQVISYIRNRNVLADIYFLACIHTNGRLDRSNKVIDKLNETIKERLADKVVWIPTDKLDNEFGNLKEEYTLDGLHLSKNGYSVLEKLVLSYISK